MDRDHDVPWKFLYNVIELGTRLRDLSVIKQEFCVKEPEVGVFGPKIRELDGLTLVTNSVEAGTAASSIMMTQE